MPVPSFTLLGASALPVSISAFLLRRLPMVQVVGLSASSARETAERVRSAVAALGIDWPRLRVVVECAPLDTRKHGTALDLPIALAVLEAMGEVSIPDAAAFAGELSLTGAVRSIRGAACVARAAVAAGLLALYLPAASARECRLWADGIAIYPVADLGELLSHLRGEQLIPRLPASIPPVVAPDCRDMADVRGHVRAKRALEVAAVLGWGVLLEGSPGSGATMLAARLSGILPEMSRQEREQVTCALSAAGLLQGSSPVERPFRAPHHTISSAGMIGSAYRGTPGEVSLAHAGVLYLDDAPELQRQVMEITAAVLDAGEVSRRRASIDGHDYVIPSRALLVAHRYPCTCGYLGHPGRACGCSGESVRRYHGRLQPLSRLLPLQVTLTPPTREELLSSDERPESSASIRARVERARELLSCPAGMEIPSGSKAETVACVLAALEDRPVTAADLDEARALTRETGLESRLAG
ncbi:MAG: ATP-binding protein [Gemmatimonadota bacterium]